MCNRHENGMKNKIKTGRYFPSHSMWHVTHNIVLERRRHVEQSVVPIKDEKQQLRSKFFPVSLHLFSRTEMKTWKHCFCTPAFSCTKYTYDERTWPVHTYSCWYLENPWMKDNLIGFCMPICKWRHSKMAVYVTRFKQLPLQHIFKCVWFFNSC